MQIVTWKLFTFHYFVILVLDTNNFVLPSILYVLCPQNIWTKLSQIMVRPWYQHVIIVYRDNIYYNQTPYIGNDILCE